jgi:hypothetical protein
MSAIRDRIRSFSVRWELLPGRHYRWADRRRWGDRDRVDPWLSLIIVLLLGAVLSHCVAAFLPGR